MDQIADQFFSKIRADGMATAATGINGRDAELEEEDDDAAMMEEDDELDEEEDVEDEAGV